MRSGIVIDDGHARIFPRLLNAGCIPNKFPRCIVFHAIFTFSKIAADASFNSFTNILVVRISFSMLSIQLLMVYDDFGRF